ncbi:sigma-70 family RNA polymerase sigma factor [Streptacidiphilus sp. EB129]|uniref:sigma-70 family RNA polymerase sigma factor n=1 Tax=Streptacidiphilus sp. EB129 TaxID=3156262 RepID=UPI003518EF3B
MSQTLTLFRPVPLAVTAAVPVVAAPERLDERSMREVYTAHGTALLRFATSLTRDRQRAEDVVQEAFLRLWRHPEALHSPHASIRPWLFTVARRIVIDAVRAQALRPQEVDDADLEWRGALEDGFERLEAAQAFRQALAELSSAHRAVLLELYYRGSSVAEAAERLGVPEGTVKSRSYYALRALRGHLDC